MAKIPFDIKYRPQIESGEYKLETECGHPASVMDWEWIAHDKKKDLAIKVLKEGGLCAGYLFDYDGKRHSIFPAKEDFVLFIITPEPEPELTEFEKAVRDALEYDPDLPTEEEIVIDVKEYASELLSLARKQLIEEQYTSDPRKTDLYKLGKAEALKDLPRWKKHEEASDKLATVWNDFVTPWLDWRGHRIAVRDLEKLPGFKED